MVECAENKNESPKKEVCLSHAKTTAAQLRVVEKEKDYYKAQALGCSSCNFDAESDF